MNSQGKAKPQGSSSSELIARLQGEVSHPLDIDGATDRLGVPAFLMNPHLATTVDVSFLGVDQAINIPVQVSSRCGGRKSLYYLHAGEKVLAGIVATPRGLLFRYVSRDSGSSIPASAGDSYTEEFRDLNGSVLASDHGTLEVTNAEKGEGRLVFTGETSRPRRGWWWILWSCIAGGDRPIFT